jgi:hypothetical protein
MLLDGYGTDWPRKITLRHKGWIGYLQDNKRQAMMAKLTAQAQPKGWQPGQAVIGGAAILSPAFIEKLVRQSLLLREEIYRFKLQEDHIFSLLCYAVGMEIHDFHSGTKPMSIVWRGLEASPQELIEKGKKIVHSVRFWKDMNEEQIRLFFRGRRT